MSSPLKTIIVAALLSVTAGCEDPVTPHERVVGEYVATTLLSVENGSAIDLLARGAEVGIKLHPDGSTTGRIVVPGGAAGGGDLDADLTGSWLIVNGARVSFIHPTTTLLRNRLFEIGEGQLVSDEDGIEIVLSKL